jgi:ABC-type branched-subunit amino acid transport system substrate-binding protein
MSVDVRVDRRTLVKVGGVGAAMATAGGRWLGDVEAQEGAIKIGFLTALTGLETILGETQLECAQLAVEEINAAGGVLGRQLTMLVEDDATDPKVTVEKANKLMKQDQVDVIVGMITSAERNAAVSVTARAQELVIYPTYYEGGHCEQYLVCTGQIPNQSIDPFVPWIFENVGSTFYVAGSDYVWPRDTAKALRATVEAAGGQILGEEYFPFGTTDFSSVFNRVRDAKPEVFWTMMAGSDAVAFVKQYANSGLGIQVCTNGLDELFGAAVPEIAGTISNQSYFMTLDTPANTAFVEAFQAKFGADKRINAISEATYDAVYLYARAVEQAGSTEVEPVLQALGKVTFDAPQGTVNIDPQNQHMVTNSIIGRADEQGMFAIIENFGQIEPMLEGCNLAG